MEADRGFKRVRDETLLIWLLLFRFALAGDSGECSGDRGLIAEIVMLDRLEIVVQFMNQRHASRAVQFNNFGIADVVEVFHHRADAITVRGHQDPLA